MRIDLDNLIANGELDQFRIISEEIAGDQCYLITPGHIGVKWDNHNLIFRSSVWNSQGEPVSLSFKKFFNWGEQPLLSPPPSTIAKTSVMQKLDGSTLIISKYKGEVILRTRGTCNALNQENSYELYPLLEDPRFMLVEEGDTWEHSYVYEWYSPTNKIVLNYGDQPKFWLTSIINHADYSYRAQHEVDKFAHIWNHERPPRHTFDTLPELLEHIPKLTDIEGVCVYYNRDQDIRKLKTVQYLAIHAFKSELTLDKMVDLYFVFYRPTYQQFMDHISRQFDYECLQMSRGLVSSICDAAKEVNVIIDHTTKFVAPLKSLSRKDAALKIQEAYGQTNKTAIAFSLLDGSVVSDKQYKSLLVQILRKS